MTGVSFEPPETYAMDDDDYNYQLFLLMNETNDTTDPSYVVSKTVQLCAKKTVNQFGAKLIPVFYFVNFLLSYLGNGLVLLIIYKYEKLTTVANIFLMNLVFSNILFASSLPFWATYHLSEWIFGQALCKIVSSAYFIGFYSSILFLTLMTFDRYLAVVHALAAAKSRKRTYAIISSIGVWCISIAASVKELVLRNVWKNRLDGLMCEESGLSASSMEHWRLYSYYQQFLIFFLLPLIIVMYCYTRITVRILSTRIREKCRAIKLIFVIIFTFFSCWTPYNIVSLLRAIQISASQTEMDEEMCSDSQNLDYAFYVTRNIAYLYCCISPMFYTFLGKKFQSHFSKLVAKNIPCLSRHISLNSQSTRSTSQRAPHSVYDY
ncbi:C-C chemokine receptor type 3-like isoform X2 [Girardinichthys multiradiatus]|uniref:C-C chemokine receptor type 3-like isoform X2 n=1 Tax=Girardinichthys multiradiatus TaxID=208333 RepID=UPI001FAB671A|nr:C-C chemokine receptor type 3-like isoform X2 [Girardinichthys multiradiatus]